MRRPPTLRVHELVVDNFAGGGGASLGIEQALGRSPDLAINHDAEAIAMHAENHPSTRHLCGDVWEVDPVAACQGRPVGLAWFSPDCTFHSKARGKAPIREKGKKVRALAWVVVRWARTVRPRVIILENVEEFEDWGPVDNDGYALPHKRGLTFRIWLGKLRAAGYTVEMRQLRACDYGAPTSRKRLFVIARCDGLPIVWPRVTHGPGARASHRTAAECIEWSEPCPTIFDAKRGLVENTMRRIARGIFKFVIDAREPFLIPNRHGGDERVWSLREPVRTVTSSHRGEISLVSPTLIQTGYGERPGQAPRVPGLHKPLGTVISGGTGGNGKHALVAAYLAKHYGGHTTPGTSAARPFDTVTAQDHHALVASHMLKLHGSSRVGQQLTVPFPTVRAKGTHLAEVRAFLVKYNKDAPGTSVQRPLPTITTKDRFGIVHVMGEDYEIADIGMRMLIPREIFRAQGFPDSYRIAIPLGGKTLSKTAQVRMCGNSVSPYVARALVAANVAREEVAFA